MTSRAYLISAFALVVVGFLGINYWRSKVVAPAKLSQVTESNAEEADSRNKNVASQGDSAREESLGALNTAVNPNASDFEGSPSEKGSESSNSLSFEEVTRQLGDCLDIKNAVSDTKPTYKNLVESLRGEIGHPIANFEDWSNEHLKMKNGEERRIRLETGQDARGRPQKTLKYYKIDKEGLPELLPLTALQQSREISENLAQLRADTEPILNERSLRSYFQNGEELTVLERNGRIAEVEMLKENRAFKCSNLEAQNGNCSCSR